MNAALATCAGSFGGLGLFLIVLGGCRRERTERTTASRSLAMSVRRFQTRAIGAASLALVFFVATGWLVAVGLGALAGWAAPTLIGAKARRDAALSRTEAIATWAEQLRDTIRAAAGLQEAIVTTAAVAPEPIHTAVAELAVRIRREPLRVALARFADTVGDPTADKIVAALTLAAERQSANLTGLLSEVAAAARQQATLQLRVEASRARTYTQNALVCGITAAVIAALVVLNRAYLDAYDTVTGQLVLIGIGGLFTASGIGLARLSHIQSPDRILSPHGSINR